jgi:hypothetical protein
MQDAQAHVQPGPGVPAYQPVLLEGGHQSIDDGAVHLESLCELGDRQPTGRSCQYAEHTQPAVEGL